MAKGQKNNPARDIRKRRKRQARDMEIKQIIRMLQNIDVWLDGATDRLMRLHSKDKDLPRQLKSTIPWG